MTLRERLALKETLSKVLRQAMVIYRRSRNYDASMEGVVYVNTMLGWVNSERRVLGKPPIEVDLVARAERTALGHSDYGSKFALYCVELVEGTSPLFLNRNVVNVR